MAAVDRGYRGAKQYVETEVLLPGPPLKRDSGDQRQKKRVLCRKRAAIEPIIGHLNMIAGYRGTGSQACAHKIY